MTIDEIYARLRPVFRDVFDDDALDPRPEMTAADVEGWDSLTHIRLIVAAEKEFGVRFTTTEIARLANVGQFADLIAQKAAR